MAWRDQLIHVIDFEGSLESGVLEYGVVSWRAGEIVAVASRRCAPTGRVQREDSLVHGLEAAGLEGLECLRTDFDFFARLRESGPLAAHFANAENMLIKSVWPYPRPSPDFVRPGGTVVDWGPWVDTGRLYRQLFPALPSVKLEELIARFALQERLERVAAVHCPAERCRYHAALYDACACLLLLERLADHPAGRERSLSWLLEMSTMDPERRERMTQGELF